MDEYKYVQTFNKQNPQEPFDIPTSVLDSLEKVFQEDDQKRQELPYILSERFPKTSKAYREWSTLSNILNKVKPPKKYDLYLKVEAQLEEDNNQQLLLNLAPFLTPDSSEVPYDCKVIDATEYNISGESFVTTHAVMGGRSRGSRVDTFKIQTILEVECKDRPALKEIVFSGSAPTAKVGVEIRVYIPPTILIRDVMIGSYPPLILDVLKNNYLRLEPRETEIANVIQILREGKPVFSYISNQPRVPELFAAKK